MPDHMTDTDLQEIEARAEAATPGPWRVVERVAFLDAFDVDTPGGSCLWEGYRDTCSKVDSEFIAASRTDIPRLLAEVRRLTAENERLREWLETALPYLREIELPEVERGWCTGCATRMPHRAICAHVEVPALIEQIESLEVE